MGKFKCLTVVERAKITTLSEEMYSVRLIAKKLSIPLSTVYDTIVRYQKTRLHNDRRKIVKLKATSAAERQSIQLISKRNGRFTVRGIRDDFNCGRLKDLSLSTVKRVLRSGNLFGRVVKYIQFQFLGFSKIVQTTPGLFRYFEQEL